MHKVGVKVSFRLLGSPLQASRLGLVVQRDEQQISAASDIIVKLTGISLRGGQPNEGIVGQ